MSKKKTVVSLLFDPEIGSSTFLGMSVNFYRATQCHIQEDSTLSSAKSLQKKSAEEQIFINILSCIFVLSHVYELHECKTNAETLGHSYLTDWRWE
jgi:hypothetical protein